MRASNPIIFYGYFVVWASFLTMVVLWATFYTFGVFFKPILAEFGWSRAVTSGAFSLCSLIMGLLGVGIGGLNDKFGPRAVVSFCGALAGIGYLLMSQLRVLWQLYLFFGIILGIGMGGSFVPFMTTIARWFVNRRGLMTGIATAGVGIGAFIGPPVANGLIVAYGWRISYAILGCSVLAITLLSAQILKRDPSDLGQVPYGDNYTDHKDLYGICEGVSLGEAVYTVPFWMLVGMIFSLGICVFSIMVHIAPYATGLGISTSSAANILAVIGGFSVIGKVLLGKVADIIGFRNIFVIGFSIMVATLLWLIGAQTIWALYCFAALFGIAYGGCVTAESPLTALLFGLRAHGLIFGIASLSFTSGGALGSWLTGLLFDMTSSYQPAFIICAVLGSVGLTIAILLNPGKVNPQKKFNRYST